MMDIVFDVAGWSGAGILLLSYWLLTSKRVNATDYRYHPGNFAGGGLLLFNNLHYGAYPSGFVNLVWLAIAVVAVSPPRRFIISTPSRKDRVGESHR